MMPVTSGSRAIVWTVVIIAAAANIAGYALNWYQQFWWFDKVLHAYTSFAVTLPLGLLLYGEVLTGMRDHRFILVLTIANLGIALGALWEILELVFAALGDPDIETRLDTVTDLVMDAAGAVLAGFLSVKMLQQSRSGVTTPKTTAAGKRAMMNRR